MHWITQLDPNILLWIESHVRTKWLDPIMVFITNLGDKGLLWIILGILLMIVPVYRKTGLRVLTALLIGALITNLLLKNSVARIRPFNAVEGLTLLGRKPLDWSFPSGHTTASFAALVPCLLELPRKYGVPVAVMGIMISLSRLYVGAHYPTDVLGGMLVGIFAGTTSIVIWRYIEKRRRA